MFTESTPEMRKIQAMNTRQRASSHVTGYSAPRTLESSWLHNAIFKPNRMNSLGEFWLNEIYPNHRFLQFQILGEKKQM
jgi:hypothetical protein